MSDTKVLVDSDAFVGLIVKVDVHHQRAKEFLEKLEQEQVQLLTTNLVIGETAALLSRRFSQAEAQRFLTFSANIETFYIDPYLHKATVKLFQNQQRKGTSFVDMANVVVARKYNLQQIFSFDKVYSKDFNYETVVAS